MSFNKGKIKVKSTAKKKTSPWSKDNLMDPMGLGAGPLKEQNPYLIPEYNQPTAGGYVLPDVNRPHLPGTQATEYKMSFDTNTPDEIQIPSVVNGQYIGSRALERFNATGEQFKPMADPSSYSKYYDMINQLGLMQQAYGGENYPMYPHGGPHAGQDNTRVNMPMPGYINNPNPTFYKAPISHPSGIPTPTYAESVKSKGAVKKTVKQPLVEKIHDIASNPLTALANSRNGIPDNMGKAIESGNLDRNALEMATDVINPVAYADMVGDIGTNVQEGNYGQAALAGLGAIPYVPKGAGKFLGPTIHKIDAVPDALMGLRKRGQYWDKQGAVGKDLLHKDMINYHGTYSGRPIVEVRMPDGTPEMFYKSTDLSGKGVGGKWQTYAGHANNPKASKNWFVKDYGYKDYYGSNTFKDMADNMDAALISKFKANPKDLDQMLNFKNIQSTVDTYIPGKALGGDTNPKNEAHKKAYYWGKKASDSYVKGHMDETDPGNMFWVKGEFDEKANSKFVDWARKAKPEWYGEHSFFNYERFEPAPDKVQSRRASFPMPDINRQQYKGAQLPPQETLTQYTYDAEGNVVPMFQTIPEPSATRYDNPYHKAYGGITPMYPHGGTTHPKAYTSNQHDVQMYNDSNTIYNRSMVDLAFLRSTPNTDEYKEHMSTDLSDDVGKAFERLRDANGDYYTGDWEYRGLPAGPSWGSGAGSIMEGYGVAKFPKPSQPYQYADPKIVAKQKKLKDAGLYKGPLDGLWGYNSQQAWKKAHEPKVEEIEEEARGEHEPYVDSTPMPKLLDIKKAVQDNENNNKTRTRIETEKTIIGYEQEWTGEKWVQAPVYENIPRRVINKKYGGASIPMYPHGGDHNGIQFPIYDDTYDFMERQSDTKKVLAPEESKKNLGKPMFFDGDEGVEYVCTEGEGCTARANRAVESLMPNTSYFENPLTTKKSLNAMYSAAGTKVKGQKNTVYNPTAKEIEKYPYLEGDIESGSLDAWDIIPQFQREHPENIIFSASDDDPYKFRNKKKFAKDVWKEYDIPIGAYINVGDVSETNYSNRKGDISGSHTVRVVGYKKDGEPLIADYGKILPLSEVQYSHGNTYIGGIAGIASVPGKEKYTYKYFKQREADMNKPSTTTYLDNTKLEGKSNEYKGYHNTISKQKNYLKTALGLTDEQYDEYAKIALTLPGQESDFGTGAIYQAIKKPLSIIGAVQSSGPAQLREKNVAKKYAQTLSRFEGDDEAYNAAAVIAYIKELDGQRTSSKGWAAQGDKPGWRPFVRSEESGPKALGQAGLRLKQGKIQEGYVNAQDFLTGLPVGHDKFVDLDAKGKPREFELPYKSPNQSDAEYTIEVNTLLKKKRSDLVFKYTDDGDRAIYKKTKGNIPEIKKNLKDFVFYSWQSPSAVAHGDAEGKSTYYKKNLENYDKLFKKQLGGESSPQDNLKQNDMAYNNVPPGFHMMPDGSLMRDDEMNYGQGGAPCYECGGQMNAYEVGGSTAPQNANINSIGKSQTKLFENFLATNVATHLNNQKIPLIEQMQQQQMQMQPGMAAGGNTGKATSVYNPNLYGQRDARDAVIKNEWDAEQNFASLWGGLQEMGVNQAIDNANQGPENSIANINKANPTNPNFSSPASQQFSGAPEGTTWGTDPQTGGQSSFAPGANPYMNMGGDLPKAVDGRNVRNQSPMPNRDPYKQHGTYKPLNEQEKRWVDAERLKKGSPDNKWLNPKFSGFWDMASDANEGAYEWKSRGATMNMLAPDLAMSDPRRHRAIQNIIPGYGGGQESSILSSLTDAWTMPQNLLNEFFTGYYEDPAITYGRYINPEDKNQLTQLILSLGTDPFILGTPGQVAKGSKLMGKTAALMPIDMAKDIGVTAEQAAILVKKYGPAILENAVKGAKYIGKKGTQAYKYVDDIAKKIFTNKFAQEVAPRAYNAATKYNPFLEDTNPYSRLNFKGTESTESNRMFTGQTVPMPSSTIQQPVGPRPDQLPSNTDNQNINDMTLEELQAITGMRQYGGDAPLPMAANGQETPFMAQKYWKPAEIEQARQRQAQLQGNQWAQDITNPFSGMFMPQQGDHQAAATAMENGCFPGMDCFPGAGTETETTGAGNAGKDKKKKTTPAGTTEAPVTTTTTPAPTTSGPRKGNYEGSDGTGNGGYYDPNYYNQGYNYNQGYGYGNGPRGRHVKKVRYKEFDPVTGKKIRQWRDKDVEHGSRGNGYFGGRRGMPRKIKLHQDVYQNAQFNQAGYNPQYGPYQNPQERAAQEAAAAQGVTPDMVASDATPGWVNDPIGYRPTPPMESGMGVMAPIHSPYRRDFDPYAPDPYADLVAGSNSNELDRGDARRVARAAKEQGPNWRDPAYRGVDQGQGIFNRRDRQPSEAQVARIERRFQRQQARDEQDYAYGGESYFPQPYPGGMPDPNRQAPPYFMVEGGNTWDDPNNAVPEWIKNPLGQYGVGDTQTPNTGNAPYALTDKGQKTMEIDSKEKYGQNFGDQMSDIAPALPGVVGMFGDIVGEAMYGDNAKAKQAERDGKSAANVNTSTFGTKGGDLINSGRPAADQRVFAQNPGNNQGAWGAGNSNYYGQYGGQPQFAGGGEYYLDENEIAQLKAGGAVIEYL